LLIWSKRLEVNVRRFRTELDRGPHRLPSGPFWGVRSHKSRLLRAGSALGAVGMAQSNPPSPPTFPELATSQTPQLPKARHGSTDNRFDYLDTGTATSFLRRKGNVHGGL
jgi:hypothetical protein